MMLGDPRTDGSYISLSLDSLSWAQTSAAAAGLFSGQVQVSVDAWVRFNSLPASTIVLGQAGVFAFGSQGSSLYFQFAGQPVVLSIPTSSLLKDNNWHYICATFDGAMIRLYIDGKFNTGQSCMCQIAPSQNPVLIGQGIRGLIKRVRIYNSTLDEDTVLANMFNAPEAGTLAADFDFSVNKPVDRGPSAYPIAPKNQAFMVKVSPAVSFGSNGFVRPLGDTGINPGGRQVDPYSVQAWVYISAKTPEIQAIFVNSDLMLDTGMAFYVRYDSAATGFRLVSQRGSSGSTGQSLTSTGTIPVGTWTNVATTFDGVTLSLYLNGTLDTSLSCTPIPLYNQFGDILIGAAIQKGNPSGATTFQGYIREVDVWSRALGAPEVSGFMTNPPDAGSPGLLGAYVFTNTPARNQVNGHPLGLADGAVLSGQLGPAPVSALLAGSDCLEPPDMGLDPETMATIRANLNIRDFYDQNRGAFDAAEAADVAAFDDPADKERIRKAWADVRDKMSNNPEALPLWVTRHTIKGEHLVIVHRPKRSYVAFRTPEDSVDSCTLWKISLIFIVIAGALDAFTGVGSTLTDKAIAYIGRILSVPKIKAFLAVGAAMSASNIFSILSTLYSEGMLRQLIVLVIDVGFWTLIRVVANMLLIAAGVGYARVIASLVATAATFIYTYVNRPPTCDPLPALTLASVSFDYDPTGASVDGLTIRRNYADGVSVPEWVPGKTKPEEAPCAYAINLIAGKTPTIKAVFTIPSPTTRTVKIQATGGGILGAIDPVTLNFGSTTSITVTLSLTHQTLAAGGVQKADVTWNWQYQGDDGNWTTMATTQHRVYVIFDKPNTPWVQVPDRTNQQLPWTDVLDHACTWAAGAKSSDDVLSRVTAKVNSGINLIYDTSNGASVYTGPYNGLSNFLCGDFVDFLNTGNGNGRTINCTDCATIVTSFANILGTDVMESIMSYDIRNRVGFSCNQILAIGTTTWKVPFNGNFSYHEVAWTGTGCFTDNVYDACLQYDTGQNPWGTGPHTAGLPVKVQFSILPPSPPLPVSIGDARYRERLATNTATGIPQCQVRGSWPYTNSGRRPVK